MRRHDPAHRADRPRDLLLPGLSALTELATRAKPVCYHSCAEVSDAMKTRRGKATPVRRRKRPSDAPTAAPQARLQQKVARLSRELKETREQQTAAAEVLGIIANSPGALEPVFEAMLANAVRLCEAKFGV